jgi:hypothetical protein
MRALMLFGLVVSGSIACTGGGPGNKDGGDDTGGAPDTGLPDLWRAKGAGFAYLLDGTSDHSRLVVEVTGTLTPRDTEGYYGWLFGGRNGHLSMGPFDVVEGEVSFAEEYGFNLFDDGYASFESYVSESPPVSPGNGTPLWGGAIPDEALVAVTALLVESTATPEGDGSLRSVESTLELIRAVAQAGIDDFVDLPTCSNTTEAIYNAIGATAVNIGGSDTVSLIPDIELGIASTDPAEVTHVSLVFDDLTTAFYALGGTTDIEDFQREAIDRAYDCIERVLSHADAARDHALVASCAAQSCCDSIFSNIIEDLTLALDGEDEDGDGAIDLENEGTVECGIEFVSRLIGFPIAIGFSR